MDMLRPITKLAATVQSRDIFEILNEAYFRMMDGRKGPVHIDIPDDLLRSRLKFNSFASVKVPSRDHSRPLAI